MKKQNNIFFPLVFVMMTVATLQIHAQVLTIGSNTNYVTSGNIYLVLNNGGIKNNGTFNTGNGTVIFSGGGYTIDTGTAITYNNIILKGSGIKVNSNTVTLHDLTIEAGAKFTANGILQVSGAINNLGTFSASAGTIAFNGSAPQQIPAAMLANNLLKNLVVSNNVVLNGPLNVTGALSFGNVNSKTFSTGGFLKLASSASATARVADITNAGTNTGNQVSGDVTVERFIGVEGIIEKPKRAWRLLTAPLRSTAADVSVFTFWQNGGNNLTPEAGTLVTGTATPDALNGLDGKSGFSLLSFNGTALAGINNTKTTPLFTNPALATTHGNNSYFIFIRGDRLVTPGSTVTPTSTNLFAKGALQTNDQNFDVNPLAGKYTLIGNPYASPVDFDLVRKGNAVFSGTTPAVIPTIYFWNPNVSNYGAYATVAYDAALNGGTGGYEVTNGGTSILQTGEAFMIKTGTTGGAATITFKETYKSALVTNNAFRTGSQVEKLHIKLKLKNADSTYLPADDIIAKYNNWYTAGLGNEDAEKLLNFDENLGILRNGKTLSIEGRPLIDMNDTLFLSISKMKQNSSYALDINPLDFNAPGLVAYIEDSYLQTTALLNLQDSNHIPFNIGSAAASFASDRFRIVFRTNIVLPINFTVVKAYEKNSSIQVEWSMASEANISKYEVEKSTDGRSFTKAATKAVRTNINTDENYNWPDVTPNNGDNFYRIKAIELSGQPLYSKVVKVRMGNTGSGITVYPNPVTGNAMVLQFDNQPKGIYTAQLYNALGQQVYTAQVNYPGGSASHVLQLNNKVVSGIYQLSISNGENKRTLQVICN